MASSNLLDRWLAIIPALAGLPLRIQHARRQLYERPDDELTRCLDALCARAEQTERVAQETLLAFIPTVLDPDHVDRCAALRAAAIELGLPAAGRLLRCATPGGHLPPPRAKAADQAEQEAQATLIHGDGRPLALGERRALARRPSRQALHRMLRDPHPMVVSILLANPQVTEEDVLVMAARRPAVPAVQCEIAKRYPHKPRLRRAVVLNPGTPPAVGVPLLGLLSLPELRQVIRAMDVGSVVRATAHEIAELRPPPEGKADSPSRH